MNQDLWAIIDEMEAVVTDGMHLPLSDKALVSEHELFVLFDELRAVLPDELTEARSLVEDRERILREARDKAERMVDEAEKRAEAMTSESTITANAESRAREEIEEAEKTARSIKLEAHRYADDVLERIQEILDNASRQVSEGRESLQVPRAKPEERQAAATRESQVRSRRPKRDDD